MKKKISVVGLGALSLFILSACSTAQVSASSTSGWDKLVYFFANAIRTLSFGGSIGIGIVIFTLAIRLVLLPLFNIQIKSSQKMQELQPELKALQAEYSGKDMETKNKLYKETQKLYKKYGVNPYSSLLPLFIQMPVMLALYQALTRVSFLKTGHFLWIELSKADPYLILPILAAVFTYLSSWLTNKATKESNMAMTVMTYVMPIVIFFFSFRLASGVVLYWSVSYAFQVAQILMFNNPFKIIAERTRLENEEKERQAKIRRAKKKAHKRK